MTASSSASRPSSVELRSSTRRSQLREASVEEREAELIEARRELDRLTAELAGREEQVDRRKQEFDAYVRRVQGSFYSDR